jgi:hypothetical protein
MKQFPIKETAILLAGMGSFTAGTLARSFVKKIPTASFSPNAAMMTLGGLGALIGAAFSPVAIIWNDSFRKNYMERNPHLAKVNAHSLNVQI